MKKPLLFTGLVIFAVAVIFSACGKKALPTGALDATFTPTYTLTPTTTPDMRYDVVVLKAGNPDQGQIVAIKHEAQATWTPVVVNSTSGISSFDHITVKGKYDVKVTSLNSCYDEYQYQIDLQGSTVTVINRNDAPYLEVTSDSGFETFSVYPQNITYTVKLKTDYPYSVSNFIVEGLPASCAVNWDTSTSEMRNNNDYIKLYITTPPNHLNNISFVVKADKANCVTPNKITSQTKTISRAWSINATMQMIYYKQIEQAYYWNCQDDMDYYGAGFKNISATPAGFSGPISWELANFDLQTCGGQSLPFTNSCSNCTADMGCAGTHSFDRYKFWYSNVAGNHNSCYGTIVVRIRFYNSQGLNCYQYFRSTTYPNGCTDQICYDEYPAQYGLRKGFNNLTVAGTEQ